MFSCYLWLLQFFWAKLDILNLKTNWLLMRLKIKWTWASLKLRVRVIISLGTIKHKWCFKVPVTIYEKSLNQTLNQILNTAYLSLNTGEEWSAIAHLSTHLKYILDASLSRTLNINAYSAPCSGSKKCYITLNGPW